MKSVMSIKQIFYQYVFMANVISLLTEKTSITIQLFRRVISFKCQNASTSHHWILITYDKHLQRVV